MYRQCISGRSCLNPARVGWSPKDWIWRSFDICSKRQFWLLVVTYSAMNGVYTGYSGVLDVSLKAINLPDDQGVAGWVVFASLLGSVVACFPISACGLLLLIIIISEVGTMGETQGCVSVSLNDIFENFSDPKISLPEIYLGQRVFL